MKRTIPLISQGHEVTSKDAEANRAYDMFMGMCRRWRHPYSRRVTLAQATFNRGPEQTAHLFLRQCVSRHHFDFYLRGKIGRERRAAARNGGPAAFLRMRATKARAETQPA